MPAAKDDKTQQEDGRPARKLSKSQKRKLQKVQEEKVKRRERAEVRLAWMCLCSWVAKGAAVLW